MDGLSLHYYTVARDWKNKGSAIDFDERDWFMTMKKTLMMDELVPGIPPLWTNMIRISG